MNHAAFQVETEVALGNWPRYAEITFLLYILLYFLHIALLHNFMTAPNRLLINNIGFAIILTFAAFTSGPSAWAQPPSATPASSLVANGDFSLATKDPTWPDGWGKATPGITWETEGTTHFMRLVAQAPGKMLMLYNEVKIPDGVKNVEISFRYRTSGVQAGEQNWMDARAIFHFLDANRKLISPDPSPLRFSKDAGTWMIASESCPVPSGATILQVIPTLFKVTAGTLDLIEIKVTPVQ